MSKLPAPRTRNELGLQLAANAATKPFNVLVPAATTITGVLLGAPMLIMLLIGLATWLAASAVTFFDADEAERVGQRLRGSRAKPAIAAPTDSRVAAQLGRVEEAHGRLMRTVEASDHSLPELAGEADAILELAGLAAKRAVALHSLLDDGDLPGVRRRIAALEGRDRSGVESELLDALRSQEHHLAEAARQVEEFDVQTERLAVELASVRGGVVTMTSATDAVVAERLADDAKLLRERVGAMAEGMQELLA